MSKDITSNEPLDKEATPPWELATKETLLELMSGNKEAFQLMVDLSRLGNIYDDLIDRDKPVSEKDIHSLMAKVLLEIPENRFYREHQTEILAVMATGLINYHAANQIEALGNLEELRVSHCLRYSVIDVGLLCMKITGGYEFAAKNARRARLMFQNDTWAHYKSEHYKEQQTVRAIKAG